MQDFDRTLHNNWDRQLEDALPDCRLRGPRRRATTIYLRGIKYEKVFCADCGIPGGLVTADWCSHVFYLCDDCARSGAIGLTPVDERQIRSA